MRTTSLATKRTGRGWLGRALLLALTAGVLALALVPGGEAMGAPSARSAVASPLDWPSAGGQARPWSYWWWMANAVDEVNLSREIEQYAKAGWGGLHVIPIYGARGYEEKYVDFLSPRFMALLAHATREAQRYGMQIDLTTGTGWNFGGPDLSVANRCTALAPTTIDVQAGAKLPASLHLTTLQALTAVSGSGQPQVLLGFGAAPGLAGTWRAPAEGARLFGVGQRPCKDPVERAAPGGAGPMLNPFSAQAMTSYLARFSRAFEGFDAPLPRAMYHDSWEYRANWSAGIVDEFARRRGYRLEAELPALLGSGNEDHGRRVRADFRETLADLALDYVTTWTKWSSRHNFITRHQAHGSPGDLIDLYAAADVPETEMFRGDRSVAVSQLASSAAHVAGRKLVAAETATWLAEHFHERLSDVKDLVDLLFLAGVNHVIYHGSCYSPKEAQWPGWLYYASTQIHYRNAFWSDVPVLSSYVTRAQSLLQAGRPDQDVLIYFPSHDIWHNDEGLKPELGVHRRTWIEGRPVGVLVERLRRRGFSFDFVSGRQLERATVSNGRIAMPGGAYGAIVVPRVDVMPAALLDRLLSLAAAGAAVIFDGAIPADVPGWGDLAAHRSRLTRLRTGLPTAGPGGLGESRRGAGTVIVGEIERALGAASIHRETLVDIPGLQFVRRREVVPDATTYFLVNRGETTISTDVPLRAAAKQAVLLDPMTGNSGLVGAPGGAHGFSVPVLLAPGQSVFVRLLPRKSVAGAPFRRVVAASSAAPAPLAGTWQVEFAHGGPVLPASYSTATLGSWTEQGGDYENFAGTAAYSLRFPRPKGRGPWLLDLGDVRESARVRLNGRVLASLISPPFVVPISRLLPGDNVLEVEVTSLSTNRIRDLDRRKVPWRVFRDINFVTIDYKRFDASEWPLRPFGLLGPVTLRDGNWR